jgi:hypothetical protein
MINPEAASTERPAYIFKAHGCYKVSKIKESPSDCQDSYSLSTERSRVAISDGATQSFYSGLWSQILCNLYCSWPKLISHSQWNDWNDAARSQWIEEVNNKLEELKEAGKPSWIECLNGIKLKKDAFATFIGISLEGSYLHGICIGDSCAMLVRITKKDPDKEECCESPSVIRILPGLWQHSFDSRTSGLSSYNSDLHHLPEFFGIPVPVDKNNFRILLMTDALAHYVIDMEKRGVSVVNHLLSLSTQEEFARYVDRCRETGLANDDTTLVVIEITDAADSSAFEKVQRDIDCTQLFPVNDLREEEGFVDAIIQDSSHQSPQLPGNLSPLALSPDSVGTAETEPTSSEIYAKEASFALSQGNKTLDESDQILHSDYVINEQTAIDSPSRLDDVEARILDSSSDKGIEPSPRPTTRVLLPGEKAEEKKTPSVEARRSSSNGINPLRQVYELMKRLLSSQW